MKYPSKYITTTATGKKNTFNLSHSLITTNDFGIIKPVFMRLMVPGDDFNVNVNHFTRLMPLPCPTYGKIDIVTRGFFVPCRSLFRHWNDFMANNYVSNNNGATQTIKGTPYTYPSTIVSCFMASSFGLAKNVTSSDPHIKVIQFDGSTSADYHTHYIQLTPKGRRVYDMLNSIGLRFPWAFGTGPSIYTNSVLKQKISVMPLLALAKIYIDWIVPSRFVNEYMGIKGLFEKDYTDNANLYFDSNALSNLLKPLYSYYSDDFFTSAFTSPFGVETNMASSVTISQPNDGDFAQGFAQMMLKDQQTAQAGAYLDPIDNPINYFAMQSLGALQHMINNGKLAGTKVQDYFKTTYNIDIDPKILNISSYLGSSRSTIQIGDVMSQAGTEFNALGQFAGKGLGGSSNEKFSFQSQEHGFFFVTSEIVVAASYTDGLAHEFQMKDRLDYFAVPELDNLGVEAVSVGDLQNALNNQAGLAFLPNAERYFPNAVFGFTPRYSKFKTGFDRLSGDFRVAYMSENLKSWYLKRNFELENNDDWRIINSKFCQADTDQMSQNYDYIFNVANNSVDHFYQIFQIQVTARRPMQTISQALEVEHKPKNGVTTGVKLNGSVE